MRTSALIIATVALSLPCGCAAPRPAAESSLARSPAEAESWRGFVGSWHTTGRQRSLVVSIHADGQALVLFMQPGQHSIKHVQWEPFHGGILIQDITRIRLWPGRHERELRAEFEQFESRKATEQVFPTSFFMRRVSEKQVLAELLDRPVPEHWERVQVDEAWDSAAGKRRSALNLRK